MHADDGAGAGTPRAARAATALKAAAGAPAPSAGAVEPGVEDPERASEAVEPGVEDPERASEAVEPDAGATAPAAGMGTGPDAVAVGPPDVPAVPITRVPPVVVPRWMQLVLLPLAILGLWEVARAAGTVLLLFIVAAVIALILNPLVAFIHRGRIPRTLAVVAVYLAFFTTVIGAGFLLSGPVSDQATSFAHNVPGLVKDANHSLAGVQRFFDRHGIHVQITGKGSSSALATLQSRIVQGSGQIVSFTGDLLQRLVELSFYFVLVLVLSVYMLVYAPRIGTLVRSVMPAGNGLPSDDYPTRVQRAVAHYVRGQLLFSVIMGTSAGVLLWIYGLTGIFPDGGTYAFAFGIFFGLMELVPYVGPVLGALPPLIVALLQDPLTAVWVALLFLGLQQLEGHVVAPQLFGHTLRLNPLVVIFALLLGEQIYGFAGALVALPLAAVLRETVIYLTRHLTLEPWGVTMPLGLAQPPPDPPSAQGQPGTRG